MQSPEKVNAPTVAMSLVKEAALFVGPTLAIAPVLWGVGAVTAQGALRHVLAVLLIWLVFLCVKTAFRGRRMAPLAFAFAVGQAAAWILLLALQLASMLAINAWGQLLTWQVAKAYLIQGASILDVLGVPEWALVLAVGGILVPIAAATRFFRQSPLDSLELRNVSPKLRDVAFAGAAIGLGHYLLVSSAGLDRSEREPIALFVAPHGQVASLQNWSIVPSPHKEAEAEADRASYVPAPSARRPNVVLIVVDALRADHLGVSGYRRPLTPNIDRWASQGNAIIAPMFRSVCAESSCGLMAIARSKYPWEITAVDFSLYEVLERNGYRNFFYLTGDHTNFYGLREAFRPYDVYLDSTHRPNAYINDDEAILDAFMEAPRFDGKPTFIQFHLMSAHGLALRNDRYGGYLPQQSPYALHLHRRLPEGADLEKIVNFYDNGVARMDAVFGRIKDLLESKGYLENALVILTGDHGELLGEGGYVTHARSTEEPVLSPPLILRRYPDSAPTVAGDAIPPLLSQVDVAPTILHMVGITAPSTWSGVPLQSAPRERVVFFSQGREVGLYESSADAIRKVVMDSRSSAIKAWRWQGGITLRSESLEDDPSEASKLNMWRGLLRDEVGPAWSGTIEGE